MLLLSCHQCDHHDVFMLVSMYTTVLRKIYMWCCNEGSLELATTVSKDSNGESLETGEIAFFEKHLPNCPLLCVPIFH